MTLCRYCRSPHHTEQNCTTAHGPYTCQCVIPVPDGIGECVTCHRLVREKVHMR